MPIIVDEVVISVEAQNQPAGVQVTPVEDRQKLITECVEQVLEILKQKTER
jgi:hypothetical protein